MNIFTFACALQGMDVVLVYVTVAVQQLQFVVNPVVCFLSARLLNTQTLHQTLINSVELFCVLGRVCSGSRPRPSLLSHPLLLHKVDIGGAFDLHRLALTVVQRQHEVEEV